LDRLPTRPSPAILLVILTALSATTRALLALWIHLPLFFPDEWINTGLSRSVFTGPFATIHGARVPASLSISYVGPLVTSPLWLIGNVAVAYHLSQAVGCLAFACSTFPTYLIARRIGVSPRGGVTAAALAQLVPAGVFTVTLLSEPYAYTAFLLCLLLAIDAVAMPTPRRLVLLSLAAVMLCLVGGLQFLLFPAACAVALVSAAPCWGAAAKRAVLLAVLGTLAIAALYAAGHGSIVDRVLVSARSQRYPIGGLLGWYGLNLFVVALTAGWILVPGAVVGLWKLVATGAKRPKAFGHLSVLLVAGFVLEAAIWGANGNGVYERFTFYAAPLIAIAFVRTIETDRSERRRAYAGVAYAAAAAALLVPLSSQITENLGQSPTMLGLNAGLIVRLHSPPLVWAPLLAVLAVGAAGAGARHGLALATTAAAVCVVAGAVGMRTLIDRNAPIPHTHSSSDAALLFTPTQPTDAIQAMQTMFWNPNIRRLIGLGSSASPDTLRLTLATVASPGVIETTDGTRVNGPFVVAPGTMARSTSRIFADGGRAQVFAGSPRLVFFGWYRGYIGFFSRLFAAGGANRSYRAAVHLARVSDERTRIGFRCTSGRRQRLVTVPPAGTTLYIPLPAGKSQDCRIGLAEGAVRDHAGDSVIARATIAVQPE
jgi:hypothetical protein